MAGEDFRSSCAEPGLTLYGSSFKTAQQHPLRTYTEKNVMAGKLVCFLFFKKTVSEMTGIVKPMKWQIGIMVCVYPGCYFTH